MFFFFLLVRSFFCSARPFLCSARRVPPFGQGSGGEAPRKRRGLIIAFWWGSHTPAQERPTLPEPARKLPKAAVGQIQPAPGPAASPDPYWEVLQESAVP